MEFHGMGIGSRGKAPSTVAPHFFRRRPDLTFCEGLRNNITLDFRESPALCRPTSREQAVCITDALECMGSATGPPGMHRPQSRNGRNLTFRAPAVCCSSICSAFLPFSRETIEGNHLKIVLKGQTRRMAPWWGFSSPGKGILWAWLFAPSGGLEMGRLPPLWAGFPSCSATTHAETGQFLSSSEIVLPYCKNRQPHRRGSWYRLQEPMAHATDNLWISLKKVLFPSAQEATTDRLYFELYCF